MSLVRCHFLAVRRGYGRGYLFLQILKSLFYRLLFNLEGGHPIRHNTLLGSVRTFPLHRHNVERPDIQASGLSQVEADASKQSHGKPWVAPGVEMAPQHLSRLTALKIARPLKAGLYADGAGLYLQVTGSGAKSWLFRYEISGKERQMGLGSLNDVTLAQARQGAARCRLQRQAGADPIEARNVEKAKAALDAARGTTFKVAAERYIDAHQAGWRNPKHGKQWRATLETYAYPVLGPVPVQAVDTPLVLKVLEPIWTTIPETASRVRGRIEVILDASKARGERQGENPARWKGHLDQILARRAKVRRVKHHPALAYADMAAFLRELREQPGTASKALEFLILTASRTGEVIGAKWPELDLEAKLWTVPAERMKGHREHRVPLCAQAVALLKRQRKACEESGEKEFVFPGDRAGRGLSNGAMLMLLDRMGRGDITAHGFRSTFKDWASETTAYPRELAEAALAHALDDKTEAAYRRGDMIEKRRRMLADWACYCETPPAEKGNVVAMRGRK